MFLFDSIPWQAAVMWFVVLAALVGLNELVRWSKTAAIGIFIVLPVVLTIFVWPYTAGAGSSTGTWFHWVKVYSALAGCIGFMLIRYFPRIGQMKYALLFPPAILALNIAEAVIRDFQVSGMDGMVDGVFMVGGSWNVMNGIAGILNLLTICGWAGIYITRDRFKDMVWPDMMWFWIIAYDLWNFAYVYNCVGDHAFYAGAALLISCTIPAFFLRKGAWLQHRAHTLAFWMMFTMAVPTFVSDSSFAVDSSHDPKALFVVSLISLLANVAVAVYQVKVIVTKRRNPLRDELFTDHKSYQELAKDRPELATAGTTTA
ncbi:MULTISPECIES: DUF5692 family protein [Oerskovia]|uniref:Uncharacterized protein n=1 Tax=Oerskovia rustica TaxID=2762237 RepID=A0ABR8RMK0_9CELL|nr:DUF5692 family protein [Oerskovia rustica]MBD7949022.1 hypothetical protein [Oerskovia rustica]